MGYIRHVYSEGNWFSIQGKNKTVKNLTDEQIGALCKRNLEEGLESDKTLRVKVACSGRRKYVQEEGRIYDQTKTAHSQKFSFIKQLFARFVQFLRRGKLSKEEERKLQVQFAMQLFKAEDDLLLEQMFPSDSTHADGGISDLPFSLVLRQWADTIEAVDPNDVKLESLEKLIGYQKAIEDICKTKSARKRAELRRKLNTLIERDLNGAQDGSTIYIPGGIYNPEQSMPMLYALTKRREDVHIDAIDISGRLFEGVEERAEEGKTEAELMRKAVGETEGKGAVFCAEMHVQKKLSEIPDFVNKATRLLSGSESKELPTELTPFRAICMMARMKISDLFFGEDEWQKYTHENPAIKSREEGLKELGLEGREASLIKYRASKKPPGAYTKAFLRHIDVGAYRIDKVRVRSKALFSVWDSAGVQIADAQFRSWFSENATKLLREISKEDIGLSDPEKRNVEDSLQMILTEIEEYDAHQTMRAEQRAEGKKGFTEPLRPSTPFLPMRAVSARPIHPAIIEKPLSMEQILEDRNIDAFEEHVAEIKKLTDKREFSKVHFYVKEMFLGLERCTEDQLRAIANSDDFERWLDTIQELSFLLPRASFGEGKLSPTSEDIKMYLQAMRFQDRFIRNRDDLKDDPYNDFAPDMEPVERIIQNPYVQLGDDARAIYDHISYFKDLEKKPFRGTATHEIPFGGARDDRDLRDWQLYSKYSLPEGVDQSEFYSDIGQKRHRRLLPSHVVNLRKSYCMLEAFLAPTRTLVPYSKRDILGTAGEISLEGEEGTLDEMIERGAYPAMVKRVEKLVTSRKGDVSFSFANSTPFESSGVVIGPWNMVVVDMDNPLSFSNIGSRFDFEHAGHFDRNGAAISNPLLRERCFEQTVSEQYYSAKKSQYNAFTDDGKPLATPDFYSYSDDGTREINPGYFSPPSYIKHRMKGRTEWQILQDQQQIFTLPAQTFQQLQLMQTSPDSVVENTLSFISQNQEVLDSEQYGFQVARLVERNIFRGNAFGRKSVEEQRFVFEMIFQQMRRAHVTGNHLALLHLYELARKLYVNARPTPQSNFDQVTSLLREGELQYREKGLLREYLGAQLTTFAMQTEVDVQEFLPLYFQYVAQPSSCERDDPVRERMIQELFMGIIPSLKESLEQEDRRNELCAHVTAALGIEAEGAWESAGTSGLVFSQGPYTVDFSRCEVWKNNVRSGRLPPAITSSELFSHIERIISQEAPGAKAADVSWKITPTVISTAETSCDALEYECSPNDRLFRIVAGADGSVRLYRKDSGNKWFMYQPDLFSGSISNKDEKKPPDTLPRSALRGDCWIRDDAKELLIEKAGEPLWRSKLSGEKGLHIRSLERLKDGKVALNLVRSREVERFFDLEERAYVTALGDTKRADRVEYGRFDYGLEQKGGRWFSTSHKKYFLSDHSLESYAQAPKYSAEVSENQEVKEGLARFERLFHPSFSHYHLLEHDKKIPKLVMPGVALRQAGGRAGTPYRFEPQWGVGDLEAIRLYEFDVDPIKGLVPKEQPEGYLYLAYVLAVQGNIKDASYYFQKANFNRPLSEEGKEIFSWFEKVVKSLPKGSLEGALLDAHLFLARPQVLGLEIDSFGKEGQLRALQSKIKYEALCELKAGQEEVAADLRQIAHRSWISVIYEMSKNPEKKALFTRVPPLLDIVFFESDPDSTPDANRENILQRIRTADCCEETKRRLEDLAGMIVERGSDESLDFARVQTLLSLHEWQELDKSLLGPIGIGLRELKIMRDEGGFERFEAINREENIFSPAAVRHLAFLSRIRENLSLQNRIDDLGRTIEKRKGEERVLIPQKGAEVEIFDDGERARWRDLFEEAKVSFGEISTDDLKPVESEGEMSEYAQELNADLREDLCYFVASSPNVDVDVRKEAATSVGKELSGEAGISRAVSDKGRLCNTLAELEQEKMKEAQLARRRCLNALKPNATQQPLIDRFRRVGRPTPDMLFDTAVRCYGEGNWEPLLALLQPDTEFDIEDLGREIASFLKTSIQARQAQTARAVAEKLPEDSSDPEYIQKSNEIDALLSARWQYQVDEDPIAPTLLLIEYELGFICRASQLSVVRENLRKENQFKQEICGGGKTTVLRNIISQARADGTTLSGVSTLEPLRAEHGLLFARTTKNAFGEQVFNFRFDRTSPTDEISLRRLHRNLLEITVNRGRIDLTKGDLQSLKLSMLLKSQEISLKRRESSGKIDDELKAIEEEIETLHKELDVMEDIRDFLFENGSIMADELDKDCDPTQEKNYAYGHVDELNKDEQFAACCILKILCAAASGTCKVLAEAFSENRHCKLEEGVRKEAIEEIAREIYTILGRETGVEESAFVSYLIHPNSDEAEAVFKALFEGKDISPELARIAFCRKFLSEVIPNALKKRAGVSYGRSERDGVSVIPYVGSDKPKEGSMHGNEAERIWYTCADYFQNGVTAGQARALWIQAKQKAAKQAVEAHKKDPSRTVSIDEMPAAQEFAKQFLRFGEGEEELTLSKVQERHVDAIVERINGETDLKIEFIEKTILPSLRQESEKIVSDAQDPPHMVKSYSGSSGTDTGMHALPDKIVIEGARQEGVHGRIIAALKESEKKQESPFLPCESEESLYELLAENMEGGDCLVDVGRLFPGIAPKDIARKMIEGARAKGVEYIIFMDSEDRWKMLRTDNGEEEKYESPKDSEAAKRRITVFDDVHTRGAERDSTEGVTEFVTVDVDSDWSRFEQGVARERNLMKGKANIRYILSPELRAQLGEEVTLNRLQSLILTKNEAEQLQQINYKAEQQRVKHILRRTGERALREMSSGCRKMHSSKHHEVREHIFALERGLFFCENRIDILQAACPQKERDTSDVLDGLVDRQLSDVLNPLIEDLKADEELCKITNPVSFTDIKQQLKDVMEGIDSLLEDYANFSAVAETLKQSPSPLVKALAQGILNRVEPLKEDIDAIIKQKRELEKIFSDELFEKLTEDMKIDFSDRVQELGNRIDLSLGKALLELNEQRQALMGTQAEFLSPLFDVPSDRMRALQQKGVDLKKTAKPLVNIAEEILEEARPLLLAKHSEENIPQKYRDEVARLREQGKGRVDKKYLPKTVVGGASDLDNEAEVETEQEQEVETEQEQDFDEEKGGEDQIFSRIPIEQYHMPGEGLGIIPNGHRLDAFFPFKQEGKFCTENCFPVSRSEGKLRPWGQRNGQLVLPPAQKRTERSFFVIEGNQVQEFWGDQLDMDRVFSRVAREKGKPYSCFIFNYGLGAVDSGSSIESFDDGRQKEIMEYIVATMIHRGDTEFTETETTSTNFYGALLRFLEKQDDLAFLEGAVKAAVAKYRPDTSYEKSSLQRAFKEVRHR